MRQARSCYLNQITVKTCWLQMCHTERQNETRMCCISLDGDRAVVVHCCDNWIAHSVRKVGCRLANYTTHAVYPRYVNIYVVISPRYCTLLYTLDETWRVLPQSSKTRKIACKLLAKEHDARFRICTHEKTHVRKDACHKYVWMQCNG